MKSSTISVAIFLPFLSGCIESTSLENAGQFQESLRSALINQINRQLSKAVDDPYSIPIFANISTADVTTDGTLNVAPSWSQAAGKITRGVDLKLGDFSSTAKLTIAPENSTIGMLVTRDLFAYETIGAQMTSEEIKLLLTTPPPWGWFHHAFVGSYPSDCRPQDCALIGNYGKYSLYTSNQKSYSDFVILVSGSILLDQTPPDSATSQDTGKKGGTTKIKKPTSVHLGTNNSTSLPFNNSAPSSTFKPDPNQVSAPTKPAFVPSNTLSIQQIK